MRIHLSVLVFTSIVASHGQALAEAQNLPTRRAGLWAITMTDESGKTPPQVMQQCIDAKTDQMMNAFSGGIGAEMCSKQEIRKVGATIVINAECQVGPMRSISESVVSGDFNSNYTVRVTTKVEGLPAAAQAMVGGPEGDPGEMGGRMCEGPAPRRHHDGGRQDHEHLRFEEDDGWRGRSASRRGTASV